MNTNEAQKIMAYHDNEIDSEDIAIVENLLENDSEAREFLDMLIKADQAANKKFDDMLNQPVPDRLIRAAKGLPDDNTESNIVKFPMRKEKQWLLATAASVLVIAGTFSSGLFENKDISPDTVYASLLNNTLESTPSGELQKSDDENWQLMPVATFEVKDLGICREYAGLYGSEQFFGLACRSNAGRWESLVESSIPNQDTQTYIPAAGGEDLIANKLADLGTNRLLKYAEEQVLLEESWK